MIVYRICHTLSRVFGAVFFRLRVHGREHMPESGGALIVSNHVSFLDPPLIGCAYRQPIFYLARKTLFKGPLAWLLPRIQVIPVDQGKADMAGLKRVLAMLKSGHRVLLFPEGTRSPDGSLQAAEAGVGFIIAKCGTPVIPTRIFGAHEAFPRHSKFPRPGRVHVVSGPPVDFSTIPAGLSGRELYEAYAATVMLAIGRLQDTR
ncbi:MAG: lysophospholipid acyltransferase family protein [Verrucomicrobiales bacterium]